MQKPKISILMGSDHDLPVMKEAGEVLASFEIPFEYSVTSAHRSPGRTVEIARTAEERGIKVMIVGAGMAAHLAGSVAAWTTLPVLGVPIEASLGGIDALLSTAQMPPGVPVGTMGIGKAGARNAALLAVQILALSDPGLKERLRLYKETMAREVEEKDRRLQNPSRRE